MPLTRYVGRSEAETLRLIRSALGRAANEGPRFREFLAMSLSGLRGFLPTEVRADVLEYLFTTAEDPLWLARTDALSGLFTLRRLMSPEHSRRTATPRGTSALPRGLLDTLFRGGPPEGVLWAPVP